MSQRGYNFYIPYTFKILNKHSKKINRPSSFFNSASLISITEKVKCVPILCFDIES